MVERNGMKSRRLFGQFALLSVLYALSSAPSVSLPFSALQQAEKPDWCKPLPRPEFKALEHVKVSDPWFEVYKVAPSTFAIYEPHQSEEVISYLILGSQKAILFDTGMGISDVHKLATELIMNRGAKDGAANSPLQVGHAGPSKLGASANPPLQIIVLNSHTHDDHVGGNWQFDTIYSMDTDFSRQNAKGSVEDAQAEIAPGEICGELPKGFESKSYRTKPWHITKYIHDGDTIDLGGRTIEILSTPGHTPDAITLFDRANGLLFTGDTYYPAPIWLFRPETDMDAYAKSIARLAALAPKVKVVLGAHNVPVAPPSILPGLVSSFADFRAGKASCKAQGSGKQLCTAGQFQFLVRANE